MAHGNDWAIGFMHGMHMRHDGWVELIEDEEHGGWLLPMMILRHEHDEDPEMRPEPISPEKRRDVIVAMGAGLMEHLSVISGDVAKQELVRARRNRERTGKIGRNEPCPCGSGKKYKKCCGGATVH